MAHAELCDRCDKLYRGGRAILNCPLGWTIVKFKLVQPGSPDDDERHLCPECFRGLEEYLNPPSTQ